MKVSEAVRQTTFCVLRPFSPLVALVTDRLKRLLLPAVRSQQQTPQQPDGPTYSTGERDRVGETRYVHGRPVRPRR